MIAAHHAAPTPPPQPSADQTRVFVLAALRPGSAAGAVSSPQSGAALQGLLQGLLQHLQQQGARGASLGNFHLLAPAVYVLAALSIVTVCHTMMLRS